MQFAHAMVLPGRTSFSQSILIAGLNYVSNAVVTVPSLFDVPSKTPIMPNQKNVHLLCHAILAFSLGIVILPSFGWLPGVRFRPHNMAPRPGRTKMQTAQSFWVPPLPDGDAARSHCSSKGRLIAETSDMVESGA